MKMRALFNRSQIDRISEILGNLGLVTVASLILPSITDATYEPIMIVSGIIITSICFISSITLLKGGRYL